MQRLGILTHAPDPVRIYCDSMAALAYAKDPKSHGRTKHLQVRVVVDQVRNIVAQTKGSGPEAHFYESDGCGSAYQTHCLGCVCITS